MKNYWKIGVLSMISLMVHGSEIVHTVKEFNRLYPGESTAPIKVIKKNNRERDEYIRFCRSVKVVVSQQNSPEAVSPAAYFIANRVGSLSPYGNSCSPSPQDWQQR